jgi:hypothetical protein
MNRDFQYVRIAGDFVYHAVKPCEMVTRCGKEFTKRELTETWALKDSSPAYQCLHCFPVGKEAMNLKAEISTTQAAGAMIGDGNRDQWAELLEKHGGYQVRMAISKIRKATGERQAKLEAVAKELKHKFKEQPKPGQSLAPGGPAPLTKEQRAAVEAGIADDKAGRVSTPRPPPAAELEESDEDLEDASPAAAETKPACVNASAPKPELPHLITKGKTTSLAEMPDRQEGDVATPPPAAAEPLATGITAAVEQISPGRAQAWYLKSQGNRELRKQHIEWLAAQMREGSWEVTGQAVVFAADGRLLDGHHRLQAIIKADTTVPMLVVYGIPVSAWGKIDCGVVRAIHDRLQLLDGPSNNRRAVEILQQLRRIEQQHRGRLTPETIRHDWQELEPHVSKVVGMFPKKIPGLTRIPVLCALTRYHQRDAAKAIELAQQLLTGANLASDSPALVLRNWLMIESGPSATGTGSTAADEMYWRAVTACRAHRSGAALQTLVRASGWGDEHQKASA